ncbi:MAG: RluA family pseudouridine synthase [Verrucomicrobia bacterium]|nr:RluA family pseudouridine synthase [Verrucomicrobiota bacterium]
MPLPTHVILVEQSLRSERLDVYVRSQVPELSRGTIQRLMDEGQITVDGKVVKPTHHPRIGEKIEITIPDAKPAEAQPENIPLEILFEDTDLLVLNKPPGIVVHPAAGNEEHTLVNALLHHCAGKLSGIGGVARPGIVHRLDKDTSGCLVVAKNDATHIALSEQFSGRTLEKLYHAILCGDLPKKSGDLRGAIGRHKVQRKKMAVNETKGREAHTSYQVLERLKGATFVEATIHTGRTHQIRVHFQHLGFPVLGDETYGARQSTKFAQTSGYKAPRQMLHAYQITFVHPKTNEPLTCTAPWSEDFKHAFETLRVEKKQVG